MVDVASASDGGELPVFHRTGRHAGVRLKHRSIGRVRDAAIVPVLDSSRIDRVLVGGGDSWLTIRYDQIRSIALASGIALATSSSPPTTRMSTCSASGGTCWTSRSSTSTAAKWCASTISPSRSATDGQRDTLAVLEVDIGVRSIFRRLLQNALPPRWIRRLQEPIPPSSIRWDFCNVLEPDPLRRLRLNISYTSWN